MAPRRIQHEGFTKLDAAQTMTWGCDAGMTTCARKVGRLDELLEMSVDIILEVSSCRSAMFCPRETNTSPR